MTKSQRRDEHTCSRVQILARLHTNKACSSSCKSCNSHTSQCIHWDNKLCLAFRWKKTHVSSSVGTLASLDNNNYRIP
eukprot:1146646-Pelagomonas_calceolata.AAC.2